MRTIIEAVIIDDDPLSSVFLKTLINSNFKDIDITGVGSDVKSGIEVIKDKNPDLVFLDILLPDGTGFDILSSLDSTNFQVIFITANDQYALKAFEFSAVDYIIKPIKIEELNKAIDKFRSYKNINNISEKIQVLKDNFEAPEKKLILPTMAGLKIVNIDNIIRFEASDSYTYVFIKDEKNPILISKGLINFEELLQDKNFARIHNKHLINLKYVTEYFRGKGGYVKMIDGKEIEVSTRKKADFMDALHKVALNIKS